MAPGTYHPEMGPPLAVATPDALHREFARERTRSARRVNLLRFAGGAFLDKPFDVRHLRSLVRASVERERSPQP